MPYPAGEPAWQVQELQSLSNQGLLSGVNPLVLAGIAQEESGFEVAGAGINPSDYGGYFGLHYGEQYPAGSVSQATLNTNSPASFIDQAIIAASSFAKDLTGAGGNVNQAETVYQTGSYSPKTGYSAGVAVVDAALGQTNALQGQNNVGTLAGSGSNWWSWLDPFGFFGSPGTGSGQGAPPGSIVTPLSPGGFAQGITGEIGSGIGSGIVGAIGVLVNPLRNFLEDTGLIILGIIIVVVGLVVVSHGARSSSDDDNDHAGAGRELAESAAEA